MSAERHRFKIGTFECTAISDGVFTYPHPSSLLFVNAPKEHLERKLHARNLQLEQWTEWISPYICLLVNTDENLVLVDTGAGGLAPTTGKLISNLQAEGVKPEDIDIVINTHGHPDHIGGNVDVEGKPAFPKAQYVMLKDEWDFWASDPTLAELSVPEHIKEVLITVAGNNLPPIQDQLNLVGHEAEIVPGIRAIATPGHTPGHMALSVSSEDEQLLYISDTAIHPIHLESPDWYASVDFAPEQVVKTRRSLFKKASADKSLIQAFHFPFPGLGYIVQKEKVWRWQPI